jgi:hypothetical protein
MLCASHHKVIVSNCSNHIGLIHYLEDFKIPHLGLVIGVRELSQLITEKYYKHVNGMLLAEFGQLFMKNLKVYAYPSLSDDLEELITLENLLIPSGIGFLVKFLIENRFIVQIQEFNREMLSIIPDDIFHMIQTGEDGWEPYVPQNLIQTIKEKGLFGYMA